MKKIISIILLMQICVSAFSQGYYLDMRNAGDDNYPKEHKSPLILPNVSYVNSIITIEHSSSIDYLQVIIRDEDGNIIYNNVVTLLPPSLTLTLSDAVDENKYSIELIYGSIHLIGYF